MLSPRRAGGAVLLAMLATSTGQALAQGEEPVPEASAPAPSPPPPPRTPGADETAAADHARLSGLVAAGAEAEIRTHHWLAARSLAVSAGVAGFSIYGYAHADEDREKTAAIVGMVLGGLGVVFGGLSLLGTGGGPLVQLQRANERKALTLAGPGERVAALERGLERSATEAGRGRVIRGVFSTVTGALLLGATTVFLAVDDDYTRTGRNTIAIAGYLIGIDRLFDGLGDLVWTRTRVEETWASWQRMRGGVSF